MSATSLDIILLAALAFGCFAGLLALSREVIALKRDLVRLKRAVAALAVEQAAKRVRELEKASEARFTAAERERRAKQ